MDRPLVDAGLMAELVQYSRILTEELEESILDIATGHHATFAYRITLSLAGINQCLDTNIIKNQGGISNSTTQEDVENVQDLIDWTSTFVFALKEATIEFRLCTSDTVIIESEFEYLAAYLYSMENIRSQVRAIEVYSENVPARNDILAGLRGVVLEVIAVSDQLREKLLNIAWEVGMPGRCQHRGSLESQINTTDVTETIAREIGAIETSSHGYHVNRIRHEGEPDPEPVPGLEPDEDHDFTRLALN